MSMRVYDKSGNRFYVSVGEWRSLWDMCAAFAPEIIVRVKYGRDDADSLGAADAVALAEVLTVALDEGKIVRSIEEAAAKWAALPAEECPFCEGTGTRSDWFGVRSGMFANHYCDECDGTGKRWPIDNWDCVDVQKVRKFRDFLITSGGIQVW